MVKCVSSLMDQMITCAQQLILCTKRLRTADPGNRRSRGYGGEGNRDDALMQPILLFLDHRHHCLPVAIDLRKSIIHT